MYHHDSRGNRLGSDRIDSQVGEVPDFKRDVGHARRSTRPGARCVDESIPEHTVCCGCVRALTAGYVVSFLVLLEGVFVLVHVIRILGVPPPWWAVLSDHNPFANVQSVLLLSLGIGDVSFALLGAAGLWMSSDASSVPRHLWSMQSTIVRWPVVLLAWWRLAVAFVAAPCVGVVLAFEPPAFGKAHVFQSTLVYVAVSVFFVYLLLASYRQACTQSALLQYQLRLLARGRKGGEQQGFVGADPHGLSLGLGGSPMLGTHVARLEAPVLFLCFPLEWVVAAYSLTYGAVSFICLARVCSGQTVGGWAWMVSAPTVDTMTPVEGAAYLLGGISCLFGIISIAVRHVASNTDLAESIKVSKRSTCAMLTFFVTGVLRLSMFIPVTVMVLVECDLCGIYVRGIASTSLHAQRTASSQFHCGQGDVSRMFSVVCWSLFDIIMVRAVCLLWQDYRRVQTHQVGQVNSAVPETRQSGPDAGYGITLGTGVPRTCEVRL